ncbi:amidohydrolase [Pseudoxanthomonas gei]|uniref:Amidohydrolase n=1 Tax=Pseudoxanthomonas gei TaxID=1383030 RepID=A0ABX0A7C6_9GAMM|nr:amidohydrolase family protein [Pseudoxanthomonas gei]NDK37407.1 amidohydrolase [Pseudoxanthomonas gei]
MPEAAKLALKGRVVSMDAGDRVHANAVVYIDANRITAIAPAAAPPPPGFESIKVLATGGTLYPGLMDLHNHLSYDALALWQVPKQYTNRDDWGAHADYRRLISGPMNVLGQTDGFPEAIARFAECKSLLGGVTTSQGIALFSNSGIRRYYDGLLRNVEISDGPDLPAAKARIGDVEAKSATRFLAHLQTCTCLLLHLSEGTDARARNHFHSLSLPDGRVAITDALVGIHCVALQRADFKLLAAHGGGMVWSPLSNLLLYGKTADMAAAQAEGVTIGLGSDWSPSGSKSLLGELKAAHAYSEQNGGLFPARDIVAMATRNAAKMLKWDQGLGSLEAGKRADLIVVRGVEADPYLQLIKASETDLSLVVIDGIRRYGLPRLMPDEARLEDWKVAGLRRRLDLRIADPLASASRLTLRQAVDRLQAGLKDLPALAHAIEHPPQRLRTAAAKARPRWFLELEHEEPAGLSLRTRFRGEPDAPRRISAMVASEALATPLSKLLGPLTLDPLTVAGDRSFLDRLRAQPNLPPDFRIALLKAYD